ncbi:MAG: ABC transporter ATP-binding protein/permease [Lachnospiraceae bacterium]|nr:ABC transporter ATP-binding protein/permease [Lachnospiraceae bacterium]MCD7766074.1 ABC transporter ATP-binding protein/permease [Lachnospiraceae bacterium]
MNLIIRYMKPYAARIAGSMSFKFFGTISELLIPYILEYMIDQVVPLGDVARVLLWGALMIAVAAITRYLNVEANRKAVAIASESIGALRHDMFQKTLNLSGSQFDAFGLPTLTSRMTSDSYNVQDFMVSVQAMGVRSPITLIGGIVVTMIMDPVLSGILCVLVPILGVVIFLVTRHGIPLYDRVQTSLDRVIRVMRENITGIRVVKALSKEQYEIHRFQEANKKLTDDDIRASITMATPGPLMQLTLNIGLTLVVLVGAMRVNNGAIQPGVILAFLTYFNMILQSVMGLNRIFMMASKAVASADRIDLILQTEDDQPVLPVEGHECPKDDQDAHIVFDHVSFSYHKTGEQCLADIDFSLKAGESLGIIGATGSGKTSIVNLLMRFYDCDQGGIYIHGRDVRTYEKDELRAMFGVVFQNDTIFNDTLFENISFGRHLSEFQVRRAAQAANISDFIDGLDEAYQYKADIKGANLSGGQKQRTLIARALADHPQILILDDSSSALDYKTDAALRKAICADYSSSTTIMVAQRVSSIRNLDHILVLENGRMIGYGTHEELLKNCPVYLDIYRSQMGEIA